MAESVVTFLLGHVNTLLIQEAKLLLGVDNQIILVLDQLEWIRSFLKDADKKRHKHERVRVWVNQIRDVAYDVEDTIDTYILKLERHRQRNFALRFISIPKKLNAIHTVGMRLKEIKVRLDEIPANRNRYGLGYTELEESSSFSSTDVAPKEKRSPVVEEADVVGFDEDTEKLARALLARESPRRSVVSIVGMGGLGKTTLAKYVYNRRDVKNGFQAHAWVYVSQEYSVRDLLLSIAKQVMERPKKEHETKTEKVTEEEQRKVFEEELRKLTEEELRSKILESLSRKRYLVVVDDIWATEAWDLIEKAFPDDHNGSRIMLTTRNREVALHADLSSSPHDLHLLNKDESWNLFCKKVFPNSSCPIELEQLGEQIVAKAGGLPLAIVVLGGLISTKQKSHSVWQKVLDIADWHLSEGSKQCSQVLALSYNDLPYYLKSCFLYFGMYPEDVEIEADRLIRLWIAEGFIQERGEETMEDVAEDYLEELIKRSVVQIAKRRHDGSVEACRMHDLLRDLSISEAKQDRFLEIHGSHHSVQVCRSRRLTVHLGKGNDDSITLQQYSMENLRSLLCFNEGFGKNIQRFFDGGVKLLRVLDLCGVRIKKLPMEIGHLILLKYLSLRRTCLKKLPVSIENLIKLQTLDLGGTEIEVTAHMIRNMHQLRHLIGGYSCVSRYTCCTSDWICNPCVSNRIDHLRNLQTLWNIDASGWMNGYGLEKLTNLRHWRIDLGSGQHPKVLSDSLANFHRLRSLDLIWSSMLTLQLVSFSHHMHLTHLVLCGPLEKLPDKEDFPPNLASLYLEDLGLKESVDPMATLEKLPNLRALTLLRNTYLGKKMTCSRGGFANLHHLRIEFLDNLEEWIVEEGAMPNLRSLIVWSCSKLKVISDSLKHISTLKEVEFHYVSAEIENWWRQSSSGRSGGTWSSHEGSPEESCAGEAEGASTSEAARKLCQR